MHGSFLGRQREQGHPKKKEHCETNLRGWQVHGLSRKRASSLLLSERMDRPSGTWCWGEVDDEVNKEVGFILDTEKWKFVP